MKIEKQLKYKAKTYFTDLSSHAHYFYRGKGIEFLKFSNAYILPT